MAKGSWREFDDPLIQKKISSLSNIYKEAKPLICVTSTKSGKAGKTVTLITDLILELKEKKSLLKKLKSHCGTGGTLKEGLLELQGDHVNKVAIFLEQQGYRVKPQR